MSEFGHPPDRYPTYYVRFGAEEHRYKNFGNYCIRLPGRAGIEILSFLAE